MTGFINKKYGKKKLYKYLYREQNSGFFQPKNLLKLRNVTRLAWETAIFPKYAVSQNCHFHKI